MKALFFLFVAAGCASAPGPKRPDESHRVPVNRTVPAEVAGALATDPRNRAEPKASARVEVEWR